MKITFIIAVTESYYDLCPYWFTFESKVWEN